MTVRITECPTCGSKKIKRVQRNLTEEAHGREYTVPALHFYECPSCGEQVYEPEAMRKIEAYRAASTEQARHARGSSVRRKPSTRTSAKVQTGRIARSR
jgi:YgiT-type zinc finger domain-containing protein